MTYDEQYAWYRAVVESDLAAALPAENMLPAPGGIPQCLGNAMRYSLRAGGKRLRPVLLLAGCRLFKEDLVPAQPFAAAVEMIHTYSLIHDDLPAMDNDSLRRGKPTCHIVYGEAMAILAGDALLNMAYETMSRSAHPCALDVIREISAHAGASGMVAGQALDIALTGAASDQSQVEYIHSHKTADLIAASIVSGLILGGADSNAIHSGRIFGYHLGRAFQIIDDLLDISGTEYSLGKHAGKDEAQCKPTWPALVGEPEARKDASYHTAQAIGALRNFGEKGDFLAALAHRALNRLQ